MVEALVLAAVGIKIHLLLSTYCLAVDDHIV